MPIAVLKSIYDVSSEDPCHPASNLLKNEPNKKWKTLLCGEKSAYVILQLENEIQITGIDIGNEHSAFVEILVGRTKKPNEFQELMLTSSFMTPIESKNSTNCNRVRCFDKERLVQSITNEKWNLIKVICTQPFNKHIQYGLSFIKIHVIKEIDQLTLVPDKFLKNINVATTSSTSGTENSSKFFGKFKLREESPDSDSQTGLFTRWKLSKTPENQEKKNTLAADIRKASKYENLELNANHLRPHKIVKNSTYNSDGRANSMKLDEQQPRDRNRQNLLFNETDDVPNDRYEQQIILDQARILTQKLDSEMRDKEKRRKGPNNESITDASEQRPQKEPPCSLKFKEFASIHSNTTTKEISTKNIEVKNTVNSSSSNSSKKRTLSATVSPPKTPREESTRIKRMKNERVIIYKPFNKLLENVVFTISGIQNPERADIRSKGLALGAKYRTDWDQNCTHLICAFKNTPKYNQVQQANGKIVKRSWLEKCYNSKKYLPWRRFALNNSELDQPESDEEILDITMKTIELSSTKTISSPASPVAVPEKVNEPRDSLAEYDLVDEISTNRESGTVISSDSDDTEDEIEKIQQKQQIKSPTRDRKETSTSVTKVEEQQKQKIKSPTTDRKETSTIVTTTVEQEQPTKDIYEVSTEEEEFTIKQKQKIAAKDIEKTNVSVTSNQFFQYKKFYLCPELKKVEIIKLKSIITEYFGILVDKIQTADYVITYEKMTNFHGRLVSPLWLYECNDMECLISTKRYLI